MKRDEGIKLQARVELRTNQSWENAMSSMLMGGLARRSCWTGGVFYRIDDGIGLVLKTSTGLKNQGEPERWETVADDWQTLTPMTMEALDAPSCEGELGVIEGIRFVVSGDTEGRFAPNINLSAIDAAQHAAQQECLAAENESDCDFADAMQAVLLGGSARLPGMGRVFEIATPSGREIVVESEGADGRTWVPFKPENLALISEDWIVEYPA